ncbi:710_t:CDS:1 [Acaulospora colombiana]|uniref:710_t:CDS:1 n=1 Tax=Acaulospora colombiana TaxID=27376 RepID=A0ACA9KJ59_9GLOM|nr:710_t:CDS:1 [Acaulospora colombiana]
MEGEEDSMSFSDDSEEKKIASSENDLEFFRSQGEEERLDMNSSPVGSEKEIDEAIMDERGVLQIDRPWKCDYKECNKAFKVKSNLKRHQISHTELVNILLQ